MRHVALHHQARNPERPVDAAPALPGQIEPDEQVARKEWSADVGQLARVTNRLKPPRQKNLVRLVFELVLRAQLAIGLSMDRIPARSILMRKAIFGNSCNTSRIRCHPPPKLSICPATGPSYGANFLQSRRDPSPTGPLTSASSQLV